MGSSASTKVSKTCDWIYDPGDKPEIKIIGFYEKGTMKIVRQERGNWTIDLTKPLSAQDMKGSITFDSGKDTLTLNELQKGGTALTTSKRPLTMTFMSRGCNKPDIKVNGHRIDADPRRNNLDISNKEFVDFLQNKCKAAVTEKAELTTPTKKFQIEQILLKKTPTILAKTVAGSDLQNKEKQLVYYDHYRGGYTEAQPCSGLMGQLLDSTCKCPLCLQKKDLSDSSPVANIKYQVLSVEECRSPACLDCQQDFGHGGRRLPCLTGISVTTGLLSSFLLLGGFIAYRCTRRFQAKPEPRRDSFGFLSDSRRTSFTHAEKMV